MSKILVATSNQGKFRGMMDVLGNLKNHSFCSLKDFPDIPEPEELGNSFEENAEIKARYFGEKYNTSTISEDSGIIVHAFPKKFGIYTRREIKAKDDHDWLQQFLDLLEQTTDRSATFYSVLALYSPENQKLHITQGIVHGRLAEFPQSPIEKGLPISSLFIPEGRTTVYSALSKEEYAQYSHRGIATRNMKQYLETIF